MTKLRDLNGQKFGRLTVIERAENNVRGRARWLCICECGNKKVIPGSDLVAGKSTSCGCKRNSSLSAFNKETKTIHGMRHTRLYKEWMAMKNRCSCKKGRDYYNYSGRGITICKEWQDSFEAFMKWALSNGYVDDLTLDRINVNGNYEPSNCRWATKKEQANNTRANVYLEFQGKRKTMKQWSEDLGINYHTLSARITTYGWSVEKALTTPTKKEP